MAKICGVWLESLLVYVSFLANAELQVFANGCNSTKGECTLNRSKKFTHS